MVSCATRIEVHSLKKSIGKVVRVGTRGNLPLSDELGAPTGMKHTTGEVSFADSDIDQFLKGKKRRTLDDKSIFWIRRIMGILQEVTGGCCLKGDQGRGEGYVHGYTHEQHLPVKMPQLHQRVPWVQPGSGDD